MKATITTVLVTAALVLAACHPSAYERQMGADHAACLSGSNPNACLAYKLDVQKCSPIFGNPQAAGCYR